MLTELLYLIVVHSHITRMDTKNLAIVLTPNLTRKDQPDTAVPLEQFFNALIMNKDTVLYVRTPTPFPFPFPFPSLPSESRGLQWGAAAASDSADARVRARARRGVLTRFWSSYVCVCICVCVCVYGSRPLLPCPVLSCLAGWLTSGRHGSLCLGDANPSSVAAALAGVRRGTRGERAARGAAHPLHFRGLHPLAGPCLRGAAWQSSLAAIAEIAIADAE